MGYPNVQIGMVMSNTGGQPTSIKNLTLEVARDRTTVATLPAQVFNPESEPGKELLFVALKLKPGEETRYVFRFYLDLPRNQERELREGTAALQNDIAAKRSSLLSKGVADKDIPLLEADARFVRPLEDIFRNNFIWNEGEYTITIKAVSSDGRLLVEKKFRLTLYESDAAQLRDLAQRYKYGDGVFFNFEKQWLPGIKISEA
jgi:hypothetical protein